MKFFGWGKSKDPQPQTVLQQASKPGARSAGSHGALDRSKSHSGMGSIMPGKGGSTTGMRKQQGLFDVHEGGYLAESETSMPRASTAAVAEEDAADSEEKLQDTIRFVFSHKREGLLAIGTFALEQLQSMRNTIDGSQNLDAAPDMMQSSDDEDQLQRRWVAARKTCDLPVFGDTESSGDEEEDDSKALTVYQPEPSSSPVKPIVLLSTLPPEIRRALDPLYGKKSFLPHWTDAVPPPQVQLAKAPPPFVDDDYYASRLCGLFSSRKKSLKPHRRQGNEIVPADGEDKKRIIPIELAAQEAKKSILKFVTPGVPTIGKLAKLWRASCKQSTARIAPERKPPPVKDLTPKDYPVSCGVVASGEVVTTPVPQVMRPGGGCSSPKVAEVRRRVQMADAPVELRGSSRGDYGHWIKDDEHFVVLEM